MDYYFHTNYVYIPQLSYIAAYNDELIIVFMSVLVFMILCLGISPYIICLSVCLHSLGSKWEIVIHCEHAFKLSSFIIFYHILTHTHLCISLSFQNIKQFNKNEGEKKGSSINVCYLHKYDDNISNEIIEVNLWKLLIYIYFNTLMINHNKSVFSSVIPPIKL